MDKEDAAVLKDDMFLIGKDLKTLQSQIIKRSDNGMHEVQKNTQLYDVCCMYDTDFPASQEGGSAYYAPATMEQKLRDLGEGSISVFYERIQNADEMQKKEIRRVNAYVTTPEQLRVDFVPVMNSNAKVRHAFPPRRSLLIVVFSPELPRSSMPCSRSWRPTVPRKRLSWQTRIAPSA
jgi:hypothetical protein